MGFDIVRCSVLICVAVLVVMCNAQRRRISRDCESSQSQVNMSFGLGFPPCFLAISSPNPSATQNITLRNATCRKERLSCAQRSCSDRFSFADESICYCDSFCEFFKDCCYDYPRACNKTERRNDFSKERDILSWSCVEMGWDAYWMKTICPQSWVNHDVASLCVNAPLEFNSSTYVDFLPVLGADNITYRNQHCAKCHNQNRFEFWILNVSISFVPEGVETTEDFIDYMVTLYGVKVYNYVVPGADMLRRYCLKPISSCPVGFTGYKMKDDCNISDVAIVWGRRVGSLFKNKYCALCNGEHLLACGARFPLKPESFLPSDFYLAINFKHKTKKSGFSLQPECRSKIYDNHLQVCIRQGNLVPLIDAPLDRYRVAVWFKWPYSKLHIPNITYFRSNCLTDVEPSNLFNVKRTKLALEVYMIRFDVQLSLNQSLQLLNPYSEVEQDPPNAYSIIRFLKPLTRPFSLRLSSKMVQVVKTTSRRLGCIGLQVLNTSDYFKIGTRGKIYVYKTQRNYTRDQYFKDISSPGVIKVCDKQLPNDCGGFYLAYERNEFEVQDNLSLYHIVKGVLYHFGQYTLRNNSVYVCHEVMKDGSNVIRQYITLVGLSLSIFCLIVVLVTYVMFSQLRTAPGRNIMNLTIALVLLYSIWLASREAVVFRPLCVATACGVHYFTLLVHLSMAKIAHDTSRMFADPLARQRQNSKQFKIFIILWLIPLVFVTLCFILWHFNVLDLEFTKYCLVSGRHLFAIIYIPVCLAMTFNIFCFTRSIYAMRKLEQTGQMLRAQKREKNSVFIYIRISTLVGLGWISGIIAVPVEESSYVFVFLATFQGVFIFLAFVCKKNVLMLYGNLCGTTRS